MSDLEPDIGRTYTVGISPKAITGTGVAGLGALLLGLIAPDGALISGLSSAPQGIVLALIAALISGVVTYLTPPGEVRRGPK